MTWFNVGVLEFNLQNQKSETMYLVVCLQIRTRVSIDGSLVNSFLHQRVSENPFSCEKLVLMSRLIDYWRICFRIEEPSRIVLCFDRRIVSELIFVSYNARKFILMTSCKLHFLSLNSFLCFDLWTANELVDLVEFQRIQSHICKLFSCLYQWNAIKFIFASRNTRELVLTSGPSEPALHSKRVTHCMGTSCTAL